MALKKLDCGFLCANGVSNRHLKQPANSHQGNGIMRAEGILYFFKKNDISTFTSHCLGHILSPQLADSLLHERRTTREGNFIGGVGTGIGIPTHLPDLSSGRVSGTLLINLIQTFLDFSGWTVPGTWIVVLRSTSHFRHFLRDSIWDGDICQLLCS